MARRKPPARRFTPPTPIVSARTLRKRVAERKAEAEARGKKRVANIARGAGGGEVGEVIRALLQESTHADWTLERARPAEFWDLRWTYETKSTRVAYEELADWAAAMDGHRAIAAYFAERILSVFVVVVDAELGPLTFTVAPSSRWRTAILSILERLSQFSESYGRNARDDFSQVREVTLLHRRGRGKDPHFASWVAGRREKRIKLGLPAGSDFDE